MLHNYRFSKKASQLTNMSGSPLKSTLLKSTGPDIDSSTSSGARMLLHSAELRSLNEHCQRGRSESAPETGLVGRIKDFLRRKLFSFLFDEYLTDQREFQTQLVRLLNSLCQVHDTTTWRMDDELRGSLHQLESQLAEQLGEQDRRLTKEISAIAVSQEQQLHQLETLESVARGLERIVARQGNVSQSQEANRAATETQDVDYSYLLLENRFRGSESGVAEQLSVFTDIFSNAVSPVLEIGAGRGELQELFRAKGIASYGIELDQAMVEACEEKGLDVQHGDGMRHLSELAAHSLGGLIAIQVIEHLSLAQLKQLLQLAREKVAPGGKIVFETINTESMVALSQNYFRDPTHVWPLHPDTMQYLMELAGLKVLRVVKRSAFPSAAILQEIELDAAMPPRWKSTVEGINDNVRRLNALLFGHQDYFILAEVE